MGNSESSTTTSTSSTTSASASPSLSSSIHAPPTIAPRVSAPSPTAISSSSNPSPGAYKMPGQPRNQRFYVTIPRGVQPGQHFAVLVSGQQMMVKCPEENRPGDRIIVSTPRQPLQQQYVVMVPANVKPGQQFRVVIQSQEVMVTCPRGVKPGQRVTFQLPQQEQTPTTAPNHQMFEVEVPEGVTPGQPFALIANGQRVLVTCPLNVRPGQKVRFQLPIQLNSQQLETFRVNYDKDGWMRCLGQDLKFHWVYNKSKNNLSGKSEKKNPFDVMEAAFVRQLGPTPTDKNEIRFIPAIEYITETTVKGTQISFQELNNVAMLNFNQKVEWVKSQFSALRTPWEDGHIKIRVRRHSLLQDAMDAIESIEPADMMKTFRFEFIGEPALDAGGVAREFYSVICEQICNPIAGLFLYSSVNQMCMQFNPNSSYCNEHHLRYFHMIGRILGKALMDGQITPVHFVQPLYKHLMGWPVSLKDLEHIDDQVYKNLIELLDLDDVGMLYLEFVVTEDHMGVTETVDLIEGGSSLEVTNENLHSYLIEQLKYRLLKRIAPQLVEFIRGFYDVVPEPLLSVFDFQELELLLHGLPNIDMDDWIRHTDYTGEFSSNSSHKVVGWFWEIVRSMEHENKAKLLQFVTGTAGVPVQGFGFLQGNDGNIRKFTLHGDKNVKVFPRAHTCFNRIDMPIYKSKTEMQKYLTMAVSMESSGFDIE